MITQEKYDSIIYCIERRIESRIGDFWEEPIDPSQLGEDAFRQGGCEYLDARSRNEVFKFLTGITLPQYILMRTMMVSYRQMITDEEYDAEKHINILGVSSESALYKKYKSTFGMSPKEAFERKNDMLYKEPEYWDKLSPSDQEWFHRVVEIEKVVTVERIKWNRSAYVFIPIFILFLVASILICKKILNVLSIWNGEFVCMYIVESYVAPGLPNGQLVSFEAEGVKWEFDLLKKGGIIFDSGEQYNVKILSANRHELIFLIEDNPDPYTVIQQEDGSKLLEYYVPLEGFTIKYARLLREENYNDLSKKWTGVYSLRKKDVEDGQFFEDLPLQVYVNPQYGYFMMFMEKNVNLRHYGNILYFTNDYMDVKMGVGNQVIEVKSAGDQSFMFSYYNEEYFATKCMDNSYFASKR